MNEGEKQVFIGIDVCKKETERQLLECSLFVKKFLTRITVAHSSGFARLPQPAPAKAGEAFYEACPEFAEGPSNLANFRLLTRPLSLTGRQRCHTSGGHKGRNAPA